MLSSASRGAALRVHVLNIGLIDSPFGPIDSPFGMVVLNGGAAPHAKKSTQKPNFGTFGKITIYI